MLRPLSLFLILLPFSGAAQFTIEGNVVNINDKKPLENANVFITNTTSGAHTKADGSFRLNGVNNGRYELVVSMVGFTSFRQPLVVNDSNITFKNIELIPKTIELKEVKVKPNNEWQRDYEWFKSFFLGTSENAAQCKIINPEIINLDYDDSTKRLTGSTSDFIEIQNNALGYNLKYLLNDFLWDRTKNTMSYDGAVWFENMTGTESQKRKWTKNRLNAYLGSSMHFFRSVIGNNLKEDGFWMHQLKVSPNTERPADSLIKTNLKKYKKLAEKSYKYSDSLFYWVEKSQMPIIKQTYVDSTLRLNEVVKITDHKNLFAFDCDGDYIYVAYSKKNRSGEPNFEEYYLINSKATVVAFLSSHIFFDNNGWIVNPGSAIFSGYWASKRMADLLPMDYQPPTK